MERIQSAIKKARAARQERVGPIEGGVPTPGTPAAAATAARDVTEVWRALPPFAPDSDLLERNRIVAHHSGPMTAPFDVMRTNLMHQFRANNWRRVAVTSPTSGCGKTTLSLNLAFSLARQAEMRVMVIELDLRRPSMARTLGLQSGHMFSRVLEGSERAEDNMVRFGTNLAIATNREPARNPAELLQSAGAAAALDAIEARYRPQVMIFDMPPLLMNDDTIAFLDQSDCALLVAGAEQNSLDEIDRCGQDLSAHAKVLGVVLNKCRYMERTEAYGYGDY